MIFRKNFFDRFFIKLARAFSRPLDLEPIFEHSKPDAPGLWLHGASAGELQVLILTYREARKLYPEFTPVWSYTSPNGAQVLSQLLTPEERVFSFKLTELSDQTISQIMERLKVQALALCEKDRYPQLLWPAFTAHIPVVGIDTRFSPGRRLKGFFARDQLTRNFAHIFTSRSSDYIAAKDLGLHDRLTLTTPPKIEVALNRLAVDDGESSPENSVSEKILVVGSIHKEEMPTIISALSELLAKTSIKVEIYPKDVRKPAVVSSIKKSIEKLLPSDLIERVKVDEGFGDLFFAYRDCWAAIVGGSFYAKGGGHNFFEPLVWDKPTFVGRFTRNWRDEVTEGQSLGLLRVCDDHLALAVELQQLNSDYIRPSAREWFASRPKTSRLYAEMLVAELSGE